MEILDTIPVPTSAKLSRNSLRIASARTNRALFSGTLNHWLAPEGCGSGIRMRPSRSNRSPISPVMGCPLPRNRPIANPPMGISTFGSISASSCSSHGAQSACSTREGTRSPRPAGCGPG